MTKDSTQTTQTTQTTQPKKSVAQTKKGAAALFYTSDKKPYQPKSVNNGKGRKKGVKMIERKNIEQLATTF